MKKLFLKLAFTFSTVLFYQNTYAKDIMDIFPRAFTEKWSINENLQFKNKSGNTINTKNLFDTHNSKELKWSVNNIDCKSNSNSRCIGIYIQEKPGTTNKGNGMNPFSQITSQSTYTLLKIDADKQSTIYKCDKSEFIFNLIQDNAGMSECAVYSKNSCSKWISFVNGNIASFNKIHQKANECATITEELNSFNNKINSVFKDGLDEAKTNIRSNFEDVVKEMRNPIAPPVSTAIKPLNTNSSIFVYNEIIKKTNDCEQFADFFDNPFKSNNSATTSRRRSGTAQPQSQSQDTGSTR